MKLFEREKKMKHIGVKIIFHILILCNVTIFAQNVTVLSFLQWDISPSAVSRGATSTAFGSKFSTIQYNPANINFLQKWTLSYNHRSFGAGLPDGFSYILLGGSFRFNKKHSAGLFWQRFSFGKIIRTDIDGNTIEEVTAQDFALGAIYGIRFTKNFNGGLVFKFLRSDIFGTDANSWAFDIGVRWQNLLTSSTFTIHAQDMESLGTFKPAETYSGIGIGIALLNAGPHIAYLDPSQPDPIPQRLRLGIAYHTISSTVLRLILLFDFEKELVHRGEDQADSFVKAWFTSWKEQPFKNATYHFGLDMNLIYIFSLRFGYQYQLFQDYSSSVFTLGFGIDLKFLSIQFGTWLQRENISALQMDSNLWGIRVGDIPLK